VHDRTIHGLGRIDETQPAEDAFAAKTGIEHVIMQQAIENRHDRGLRTHRRGDGLNGVTQVIRLAAQDHHIKCGLTDKCGQRIGGDMRHLQARISQPAAQDKAITLQLRRPCRADQKRDIRPGLSQPAAEIAAGTTSTEHQDAGRRGLCTRHGKVACEVKAVPSYLYKPIQTDVNLSQRICC